MIKKLLGKILYIPTDSRWPLDTSVFPQKDFAVADNEDPTIQIQLQVDPDSNPDTVTILKAPINGGVVDLGSIGGGGAVDSVNGYTGVVVLNKSDVGLGNVDNTSDVNKPVSTAQAAAIATKENTGVAAALIASHEAALDPHPQYATPSEVSAVHYTKTELDAGQLDNRYYTETEVDSALLSKADAVHTHPTSALTQTGANPGDVLTWSGTAWLPDTLPPNDVLSVNGQTGNVSLDSDLITEGTVNLYFTDTRAKTAAVVNNVISGQTDTAPSQDAVFQRLALKAPLASPALTGTPTAPTATQGDNSTTIATTAYVDTGLGTKEPAITSGTNAQYWRGDKTFQTLDKAAVGLSNVDNTSDLAKPVSTAQAAADAAALSSANTYTDSQITALINSSPATLDTLNELAAALGNDPNFATTVTTLVSTKANQALDNLSSVAINTDLSFAAANRSLSVAQAPSNTAGFSLSNTAGNGTGTDKLGGGLFLSAGAGTGANGSSPIEVKASYPLTTGSGQNATETVMKLTFDNGFGYTFADKNTIWQLGTTAGAYLQLTMYDYSGFPLRTPLPTAPKSFKWYHKDGKNTSVQNNVFFQGIDTNSGATSGGDVCFQSGRGLGSGALDGNLYLSANNIKLYHTNAPGNSFSEVARIEQGTLNMLSNKITSLGTPTTSTDAATKGYVDSLAGTRPHQSAYGTSTAVASGVNTTIVFATNDINVGSNNLNVIGGVFEVTSGNAGIYEIVTRVTFGDSAGVVVRRLGISKNSTLFDTAHWDNATAAATAKTIQIVTYMDLAVGDQIEVQLLQNTGGSITPTNDRSTIFSARKIN